MTTDFDQIYLHELVDHRILVKFYQDIDQNISGEALVANTLDDFKSLQVFRSEFWLEMQLQRTVEFLWNSD